MRGTAESIARAYAKMAVEAVAPAAVPLFAGLTLLLIPLAVIAAPEDLDGGRVVGLLDRRHRRHRRRIELDAVQMGHAQTIVNVAVAQGLEPYAATVAGHRLPGVPDPDAGQRRQQP